MSILSCPPTETVTTSRDCTGPILTPATSRGSGWGREGGTGWDTEMPFISFYLLLRILIHNVSWFCVSVPDNHHRVAAGGAAGADSSLHSRHCTYSEPVYPLLVFHKFYDILSEILMTMAELFRVVSYIFQLYPFVSEFVLFVCIFARPHILTLPVFF